MDTIPGFPALLARARTGDRAAAEELLALIRPWIEQQARKHARANRADENVSDLVQEAWLRAWQKLDQFVGHDDEEQALAMFRAWLGRIVCRLGLNALRGRAAKERTPPAKLVQLNGVHASGDSAALLDPSGSVPTPSAQVQVQEVSQKVREALGRLANPLDREFVRLRFFEGMSIRQAAARIGCNHETARQRYHAALNRLQRELRGLD
jgi:RNA polymerase sigma-70 factor (ECF subfamily)